MTATLPPLTVTAFVLLALAIACALAPAAVRRAWRPLAVAAVAAGLAAGVLTAWGALSIAALALVMHGATDAHRDTVRGLCWAVGALAMLALAVHAVPGFHNPRLFEQVRFAADSVPFTQHLNFDKGMAGLLVLAACRRALAKRPEPRASLPALGVAALALGLTAGAVLGLATSVGTVAWDPKWPAGAWAFLATNLLFTCVPEEVFFRGLVQPALARTLPSSWRMRGGGVALAVPVVGSALLFGAAHAAAGGWMALLATGVGLGCALVQAHTGRIEAAIAVHFGVNAVHFTLFSYPALAAA